MDSGNAKRKRESVPKMAPFLSKRSVVVLTVGLVIGIAIGLGYWIISPSFNSADPTVASSQGSSSPLVWPEFTGPYESTVVIQIVNPGSAYTSLTDLRRTAEYYAAKANTFPFLDFLSQELDDKAPLYVHTPEELDQMILVTYNQISDVPVIEITAVATTEEETLYLAAFVPAVFLDFLASEEDKLRLQEYELLMEDIDGIKQTLLVSEQELADYSLQGASSIIYNDSNYIALTAKVQALGSELNRQAGELAALIALGDQSQAYSDAVTAVERTSSALAEARSELSVLEAQHAIEYTEQDLVYQVAQARVDDLRNELATLTAEVTTLLTASTEESSTLDYIAVGTPSSPNAWLPDRMRGRDAILLGGIVGICGAWVTLNFKWLAKGMPSTTAVPAEEENTEETA